MNRKFTSLLTALLVSFCALAQSILPNPTTEFCPTVDVTFTVTLPRIKDGTVPNVSAWTNNPTVVIGAFNLSNTPAQTTFTFVGRFKDVNIKQEFKIDYITDANPNGLNFIPTFKYIKSLFYPSPTSQNQNGPCQPLKPNITSINAPLCQTPNIAITFPNVKWSTYGEGNDFCWGTITTYEYQLPGGWSIGSSVSTGSNWIAGNNSVTITADQSTGNGQTVKIRPTNSCAGGLQNGQSIVQIPITRSGPSLSISGAAAVCAGNNYTYTLNGAPSGATIAWKPNSYYSISGSGSSISISPYASSNGSTTVAADVTLPNCSLVFPVSFTISMGAPYVTFNIVSYPYSEPSCYEIWGIYTFQAQQATGYPNTYTGFEWGWRNLTNSTISNDPTIYGSQYSFIPEVAGDYEIWVRATNTCGASVLESVKSLTVNNACGGGMRMQQNTLPVYPNPATNKITIQIPASLRKNALLQLTNQFGVVVLTQKVNTQSQTLDVNIGSLKEGVYQLIIRSNTESRQAKVIKQ